MTTLTLLQAFDFRVSQDRLWLATIGPTDIKLESGAYAYQLKGSFVYTASGDFSGTASSVSLFIDNAETYRITGMSHDALQMAVYTNPGQTQALYGYVFGGNDTLAGSAGNDGLLGYAGDDTISAGAGADFISGGAGNDRIDGQAGVDTAAYSGNRSAYTITRTAAGFTVSDSRGVDGTDTLAGVERLVFADKTLALDVDAGATGGEAYRLYQAAFARTPDAKGVGYWISVMEKGASLESVAQGFITSKEYADAYGSNPGNRDLVTKFYQNILHRDPEKAGLDYWAGRLDDKAPVASVLAAISESKENIDGTAAVIGAGFEFIPYG
ncbi:MAG: DUF4214 domain-containing protein [Massilia sp.]